MANLFPSARAAVGLLSLALAATASATEQEEFFESRIRPLFSKNCFGCHTAAQKGGLRVDSRQNLLKGGGRGAAIVPGKPEESLLLQAVNHAHPQLRMPPPGKLSEEEIGDLQKWVKDGAAWPESPAEFFTSRVRPVLATNCLSCHSDSPQGGLRMDSRDNLLKGGKSGPAIVPGESGKSLLVKAVQYEIERLKMPPTKPLAEEEISAIMEWVKSGAAWPEGGSGGEYVITAEQKAFWSFQPPKKMPPPAVRRKDWVRTPIDNFVLAKLESKGFAPAAPADRRTLIRRVTYDLIGLPPTPGEVDAFVADKSPDAYAKVIDRLLASPRYGERWARHWMDVVRYSDTAGDSADYPIPQMHRYRDYLIGAFNRDKPYDRFVREQIAGDLLPAKADEERWEQLVATGYLANTRRFGVSPERVMHLTIDDSIDNLSKTFLGLSVACARCHDHKYDPISAKDYYALYGIFDSTRYPFAGSENRQEQADLVPRLPQEEIAKLMKPLEPELKPIDEKIKMLQDEAKASLARNQAITASGQKGGPAPLPPGTPEPRNPNLIRRDIKELTNRRTAVLAKLPPLEMAYAVAEGSPHDARVLLRGERDALGDEAPRRFLQILGGQKPANPAASGRLDLANWLSDPKNPLAARVMVNRIWQYHFGKGLVASPNDFGKRGSAPTHPELLDYLAVRFREDGWSVKAMHRLILLSQTYRQSSEGNAKNAAIDPGNDLLWKFNRQRLDAESIRDSLLAVSGALDVKMGGAQPFPTPDTWKFTQHKPYNAVYETNRRSVYLMTQRIQRHPFLALFDGPDPNASTPGRPASTTPIQALFIMNSQLVHESADLLAQRLLSDARGTREILDRAHRIALGRPPAPEEIRKAEEHLATAQLKLAAIDVPEDQHRRKSTASYLRSLLSGNEFIFVD